MDYTKTSRLVKCDNCRRQEDIEEINILPGKLLCKRCLIGYSLERFAHFSVGKPFHARKANRKYNTL